MHSAKKNFVAGGICASLPRRPPSSVHSPVSRPVPGGGLPRVAQPALWGRLLAPAADDAADGPRGQDVPGPGARLRAGPAGPSPVCGRLLPAAARRASGESDDRLPRARRLRRGRKVFCQHPGQHSREIEIIYAYLS